MSNNGQVLDGEGSIAMLVILITFITMVLLGLTFLVFKTPLRAKFGVYDIIYKNENTYSFSFDNDMSSRVNQPYVIFNGINYYMLGNITTFDYRAEKMGTLTYDQLIEMFPKKSYKNWLNGGREEIQILNNGKIGYKEQFDNIEEEEINENDNISNRINDTIINNESAIELSSKNKYNNSNNRSSIEIVNRMEETDISDMLPNSKVEYIVTTTLDKSNEIIENNTNNPKYNTNVCVNGEKHYTSGTCAICLENLEDDDIVRGLICGHVFHQICIDPWLTTRSASCPICKKDYYLEIQNNDTNNEDSNRNGILSFNFDINELFNLPTGEPGSSNLNEIFKIDRNNPISFFIIPIITRFKAQILLTALLYLRNNNYSLDDFNTDPSLDNDENIENSNNHNNENNSDILLLHIQSQRQMYDFYRSNQIISRFDQLNVSESFDTPPIPDLNKLNPYIKDIVEHHPRPFNPSDLIDLDYEALKETKKMIRGIKKVYFSLIGISKLQIYYYNVVKIYNNKRNKRLKL